jgi:LacI family transcriptional regulator
VAEGLGYAVVLQNTDRTKKRIIKCIQVLREKRADGIIFSGGIIHAYETLSSLKELTGRVVVIGRHEVDFPAVRVDNMGGATQAVQHLLDLGHERIGFISGPKMSTSSIDRLKGYKNALAQNGRHFDAGLVQQGNLTRELISGCQGGAGPREVYGHPASNDPAARWPRRRSMAQGAAGRFRGRLRQYPLGSFSSLTTVEIPMYSVGTASMQMLADLIGGVQPSGCSPPLLVRNPAPKER